MALTEADNIGKAINAATDAAEKDNEGLRGVLPKTYTRLDNALLVSLLKNFSRLDIDPEGNTFGDIYEYYLAVFAQEEGSGGGEFFKPRSLVRGLIVEVIEPSHDSSPTPGAVLSLSYHASPLERDIDYTACDRVPRLIPSVGCPSGWPDRVASLSVYRFR